MFDFLSPSVHVKRTGVCNHVDGNEKTRGELGKRRIVLCLIYREMREHIAMSHTVIFHCFAALCSCSGNTMSVIHLLLVSINVQLPLAGSNDQVSEILLISNKTTPCTSADHLD